MVNTLKTLVSQSYDYQQIVFQYKRQCVLQPIYEKTMSSENNTTFQKNLTHSLPLFIELCRKLIIIG